MNYVIIHGHFYQPPREDPSIGVITEQDSASPAHDWNERITNECYGPNAYSRLLDNYGQITKLVNNYEYISYNFGPTLIDYIAEKRRDVLEQIIEGDKKSIKRLGHGNAIAQIYNHVIMPLQNKEDMHVEAYWGIYNFQKYFGRKPEGMWLSETAINLDVVKVLYDLGIKFVILSPFQAHYVKKENGEITTVSNAKIDTSKPYILYGHGGSQIAAFFYDAPISQAIAFEHILRNVDVLASRISNAHQNGMQMVNLATDGESYGHHEPFGDMCLSRYFTDAESKYNTTVTNYAHYLSMNPPKEEVILHEGANERGTSWSCSHGVERWTADCGCSTGAREGWNQKWRTPLREAMNILRELQDIVFQKEIGLNLETRKALRSEYILAIYDNDKLYDIYEICGSLIDKKRFKLLMEAYKFSLLAYTSCGWFFADISGIEPMHNMAYAAKSFSLLRDLTNNAKYIEDLYKKFCEALSKAISNADGKNGFQIYKDIEEKEYNEYYIVNQALISIMAEKKQIEIGDSIEVYQYKIKITDKKDSIFAGTMTHTCISNKYFIVRVIESEYSIKNFIRLSSNKDDVAKSQEKTLAIKDIVSEDRIPVGSKYLSAKVEELNKSLHEVEVMLEKMFNIYEENKIFKDYKFNRILGAFYSHILYKSIEEYGESSYNKVSSMLVRLHNLHVGVSTSAITILISKTLENKFKNLEKEFSEEVVMDILKDVKFLTINDMPVKRYSLENMFYNIVENISKNDINLVKNKNLIALGKWLNFNMDKLEF